MLLHVLEGTAEPDHRLRQVRVRFSRAALIGWPAATELLGFDGYPTTIYTRVDDDAVQPVRDTLAATANPEAPNEVNVSRPSDALAAQRAADSTLNALLLGLGAVALLVGGIGVANTMVISVMSTHTGWQLQLTICTARAMGLQFTLALNIVLPSSVR